MGGGGGGAAEEYEVGDDKREVAGEGADLEAPLPGSVGAEAVDEEEGRFWGGGGGGDPIAEGGVGIEAEGFRVEAGGGEEAADEGVGEGSLM